MNHHVISVKAVDSMSNGIYGEATRELHAAWSARVGPLETRTSSPAMLQSLFNDVHLFPSKSQIFEMVQCAWECSNQLARLTSTASSMAGDAAAAVANATGGSSSSSSDRSSSGSHHSDGKRTASAVAEGHDEGLTFGEFCVFATELKKYYNSHSSETHSQTPTSSSSSSSSTSNAKGGQKKSQGSSGCVGGGSGSSGSRSDHPQKHCGGGADKKQRTELRTQKSSASVYDVFLGGSCNPTTWRMDRAIPFFKGQGITYYNPQQSNWVPEMIELEHQAKQTSQIMFFVLNRQTRNIVSMVEVAFLAGARRKLVVVLDPYPKSGHVIGGEAITETESADLNGALTTVHDLVERQGLPVFSDVGVALTCSARVLKENLAIQDLGLEDSAQPVRLAHLQVGDRLVRLREAFDTLDTGRIGKISLADLGMAFRIHAHRDLTQKDLRQVLAAHDVPVAKGAPLPLDTLMVDFDHFCCIVSEFKNRRRRRSHDADGGGGAGRKVAHLLAAPFHKLSRLAGSLRSRTQMRVHSSSLSSSSHLRRRGSQVRDVYLGGTSSGGTRWRQRDAIPMLKKQGLTFFNSQVASSSRAGRLIPIEAAAMDNSRVLLFVILATSRSVGAMCEAAYHIGRGASVVLCVQKIPEGTSLDGEGVVMSKLALKDYNRGRAYLSDIANREGVPVFEEVSEAVECILQKCKSLK